MTTKTGRSSLDEAFFAEYTTEDVVLKYTRATAGHGISYLLGHHYKEIYLEVLDRLPAETKRTGIRMLEFGCGGGMNLVHLASVLREADVRLERAVGTDFSPVLIEAARRETKRYANPEDQDKFEFHVARNESLIEDLCEATQVDLTALGGAFDLLIGVNTMRYCHRVGEETQCARDIFELLTPGGVCVNIDMNDRFPAFRSAVKRRFGAKVPEEETYIPSLEQYAAPFQEVGFQLLRMEHFCWIPHSSGPVLSAVMRGLEPALTRIAPTRAMRSLVIAQKPAPHAIARR